MFMSAQWHLTIRNIGSIAPNEPLDMLVSIMAKVLKPQGYLHHTGL